MTEEDLLALAPRLARVEPGLLSAGLEGHEREAISYPRDAHAAYAEVEDGSFWFGHRNRCLLAVLRAFPPAGALFDVGAGNGFVARALADGGFEVVAVEPGVDGARAARDRGLRPVVRATLDEAGFLPRSLPAAGLFDVIEHLSDEQPMLRSLRERLVPGGRLYVTAPAGPRLWSSEDDYAGHFRRYRRSELATRLALAGYEVEFASCFFVPLPPLIYLLRVLPERLGRRPRTSAREVRREHASPLGALAAALLRAETLALRSRRALPFGSSCLAVARA